MLEVEYQYYKSREAELVRDHEGKYLGIVGQNVVGIFDTERDAYANLKKNIWSWEIPPPTGHSCSARPHSTLP